ncbi:MAG: hypothetical protein ABJA02_16150 [Acidobacteriota bacterium]
MKLAKCALALSLSLILSTILLPTVLAPSVSAQSKDLGIALQRGYRTGYSDGYMAGYRDTIDGLNKGVTRHTEYAKADRAFNRDYGTVEDYRDGYQQGFESGYDTGFEKRSFEATLPGSIQKRGIIDPAAQATNIQAITAAPAGEVSAQTTSNSVALPVSIQNGASGIRTEGDAIIIIPRDTELMLELQEDLSTEKSRPGEKFTAKVVSPSEIAGAVIEGRIAKITSPGHIKRRSELALSFDRIVISDTRWSNFSAVLTEVMPVKGDNIHTVDTEGTAIGQSSFKSDAIKIGGATGAGLIVGGVVGGPVGAGVGAGVGAAFGVGAVVIERGKHIRINRNQQVRIKTAYETQIR